jgi:hypothetical protein|tara:strand:- start:83 stop:583 length:501 start_codon:yes stop_codon:yes gene_type:complete
MTWLLRLYPRVWRRRYGAEVREMLAAEPRSLRLGLDLIAGAVDARLNPQWTPAANKEGEHDMTVNTACTYARSSYAPHRAKASAAWMIGISLVSVLIGLALTSSFGDSVYTDALFSAAFFIALLVSNFEGRDPRPYTGAARVVILSAGSALVYGFFLSVSLLADRF